VPPPAAVPAAAAAARRAAVVERVLRTADLLSTEAAPPPSRIAVATRDGVVRLHDGDHVLLGRGAWCDVPLASARASREHAVLLRRGNAWWIEDLDSTNGTFAGGARLMVRRLADGDVVVLADEPVRVFLR